MREEEEEEGLWIKISHQKSLSVDRIQKAWNRHIEDILVSNYCLTGNIGRDSLRVLATLAESEPLSRVKPILVSCYHERLSREPQDGHSRAKRLTRADVFQTKDMIEQQNQAPKANKATRKKRARSNSRANFPPPDSPPGKHARPRRVTFKVGSEASKAPDDLRAIHGEFDLSPEISRDERAANTSNRVPRLDESDNEGSLPDMFNMNNSGSNNGTANDMGFRDEQHPLHTERDDGMTDRFARDLPFSDPWRDHNQNNSIHKSNEFDLPNDSNPPNVNRNFESRRNSSSCDTLCYTPISYNNTNASSRVSTEVTQRIADSISQMSPMDVNQQLTLIMHERCQQFRAETDFLREMLGNNLTRAQKDLYDAHQPVKLFEIGLQKAESRRDAADQTYQSAQSRSWQARIVYSEHEAIKDFGKDAAFRGDINILAEQMRSKWTEIEEELENATKSTELAHAAATEQAKALQELKAAGVPLRVREEKAKEAWDACKETLERMDSGLPGLAEMMMRTFASILPQDVLAMEGNASSAGIDDVTTT